VPEITAAMVKELREKTGAGMMDCKRALAETGGNLEEAVDLLRKKGLAAAAKKSGRAAAEGLVGVASSQGRAAMVEVNVETDFVARNDQFQTFVEAVAKIALQVGEDLDAIKAAQYPGSEQTVSGRLNELIAKIGENMTVRRARMLTGNVVATYVHSALRPGLGKIGVLIALDGVGELSALEMLGRQVGMHVAAS
jgi:elongation factor Ts